MRKLNEIFDTEYDTLIKNVKTNTKEINEGDLFVCIKGFNVDRHDYVKEAELKGASALVVNHKVDSNLPQIIVEDTNKELANIANKFYDYPSKKMTMIGITGTDGKTSTATILYELLNQVSKCGYIGTNGVKCQGYNDNSNNTTPTTEHLNRFLNNFYEKDCKYVSMETASEGLAQGRCDGIEFNYSIFTNLTHEHLNFHKTMGNYLDAKSILFKQTKKDGYSIINIDDPYAKQISKNCNGKVLFYGKDENADFRFCNEVITPKGTTFDLIHNKKIYNITSPLLGLFNVYNLTAVLSALITMNIDIEKLDYSILHIDGRMEHIDLGQDFKVIVDYAHTPNGYLNLFELTKTINVNRTIIVAGSAGERDRTKRPIMGKILVDNADLVIFTYEDPRSEDPNDIIDELTSKIMDKQDKFVRIVDRSEAIKYAIDIAEKNDMVLILGKGAETYEALKYGKIHFSDLEEATKHIKERLKIEIRNS